MCVRVHARVRACMRACIVRTYVLTYACMPFLLAYISLTLLGWITSPFIWGPTWNLEGNFFFFVVRNDYVRENIVLTLFQHNIHFA